MDRATELTDLANPDAFVEVRFSDYDVVRTQICRRTLNPTWNEDFRFEVSDDSDLQNEPLEIKVMDYDQITYNDAIGAVFIDLNPLLAWDSNSQISGWFPIFDTLRGVRGEMNLQVKLQFFGDGNRFSDSSAGVQFFSMPCIPPTYHVSAVLGFVSTLDSEDDPEYHWADNFRTPRTSNDARTRIMFRLSGRLRRQLGKKVLDLNGNAVVGYKQYFDLESDQRVITARAIGTAVRLVPPDQLTIDRGVSWLSMQSPSALPPQSEMAALASPNMNPTTTGKNISRSPPSDGSLAREDSGSPSPKESMLPTAMMTSNYRSIEQQVMTITHLPPTAILGIGGFVCATSVKMIEDDSKETREQWWGELRDEIKSHAKVLGCPIIIGYSENITMHDDLAVLFCSGTAVILDLSLFSTLSNSSLSMERTRAPSSANSVNNGKSGGVERQTSEEHVAAGSTAATPIPTQMQRPSVNGNSFKDSYLNEKLARRRRRRRKTLGCQACHITYRRNDSTFPMAFVKCGMCRKKYVPEVILATIEPPMEVETIGKGMMIEAHVCRQKKNKVGEPHASIVSESMPFALYDIHRQLMFKLRIYGLNAVFGLKLQFSVGESLLTAVATGTAMYVKSLPTPPALKVFRNLDVVDEEDKKLLEIQKKIVQLSEYNRRQIELALQVDSAESVDGRSEKKVSRKGSQRKDTVDESDRAEGTTHTPEEPKPSGEGDDEKLTYDGRQSDSDTESDTSSDSDPELENSNRLRNVVVHIDDEQDEDLVLLLDPTFPEGFQMRSTETAPRSDPFSNRNTTYNVQMLTMVKQGVINLTSHHPNRQLSTLFKTLYQELQFHLWYISPCIVAGINYDVQILKLNELQIRLTAVALGKMPVSDEERSPQDDDDDGVDDNSFSMVEDGLRNSSTRGPRESQSNAAVLNSVRQVTEMSLMSNMTDDRSSASGDDDGLVFSMEDDDDDKKSANVPGSASTPAPAVGGSGLVGGSSTPRNPYSDFPTTNATAAASATMGSQNATSLNLSTMPNLPVSLYGINGVEITPLTYVPQAKIEKLLGRVSLHFVKESSILFEPGGGNGGMGGFAHTLLAELHAVTRAYTAALGGNAMCSFTVEQSVFEESIKNQGYSLISVSGDVVEVSCTGKKPEIPTATRILGHTH
ncbi:hypothetical protein HDV05_004371 [Chytridiales sp. JEL 0842]|nr:hypothetical protein HDV05_004371 [Chytridiales sp. JEL 0842]